MATISIPKLPQIGNEPNQHYEKGSTQRALLTQAIERAKDCHVKVPLVINGQEVTTASKGVQVNPADHQSTVATYSKAGPADIQKAIDAALSARKHWATLPFADRAAIFLKAADLISGKYRYAIMAATILGQGKNAWQAEIDSAAELADFLRFNVHYAEGLYSSQPGHHAPGVWNRVEYRPLEGFVYAISPFNFTAIAGNLVALPALLGNVVVWKPSDFAIASNYLIYRILLESGLPCNVIQWTPGDPGEITQTVFSHREFAALHYTGSTAIFRQLYGEIGAGIAEGRYKSYPRIVGETGGKNAHILHHSADIVNAAIHTIRGAFEYQGQKCSATSRVYVPSSRAQEFTDRLVAEAKALSIGEPADHTHFVGPVIHAASFSKLRAVIDSAQADAELELLSGGTYDDSKGYFITPTIYHTTNPNHPLLSTELFGPILVLFVYDDKKYEEREEDAFDDVCQLVDQTSDFGLTCAVFASDRTAIRFAEDRLRDTAGNFYINCKSTGAVVGQQPFGGGRASGTNDKAGSMNLLSRFVSMRAIKEEFTTSSVVSYPSNH
ncbi:delta-1-pyrroline-5-carboxylate dehydrogenase, mitochondrial [Aspergillus awamori]|uniref:Multifunctional fusion protein n=1 Tax=Aspergillus awamori TaxID=105351 RepID=A0A401L340_ASPAW|nr:delta-1-pyrroline-5-carboxylate dehydrogenase, mitochondrial [Aspergillus awamori]GKZ60322.1 1-pyrroline-5-carboxylate dehydrogenase [Aspergillus niger]